MMPGIRYRRLTLLALPLFGIALAASTQRDGIVAFQAGRYKEALRKLEQANARNGDSTARAFLGLTKAALGDCQAAIPILTKVSPADSDVHRLVGLASAQCYIAVNQNQKALAELEQLTHEYPRDADVLYALAKFHMRAFNDATFAMFQRTPESYRVHELSAEIFEVQNRYGEAVEEYRKAIAKNPDAPDLHYRLGRALLLRGHEKQSLADAADAFRAELRINPEDGACEFQLGQIAQVTGNGSEAKQHFTRALDLSPNFVQALIALGKIATQEKRWEEAIGLLQQAVKLQPTNETAHYALLAAYRNSGDMSKASAEKDALDKLQKPPEGEFTDFLKKLDAKKPQE